MLLVLQGQYHFELALRPDQDFCCYLSIYFCCTINWLTCWPTLTLSLFVPEWSDEQLPPTNILRLIYQGRFLHGNVTLGGKSVTRIFYLSLNHHTVKTFNSCTIDEWAALALYAFCPIATQFPWHGCITLMLLMANLANTKWCKKPEKWLKPWQMGTLLRVLGKSYPMSTNMTGFRCFSKIFASLCLGRK